jgi:hypothetical protein
MLVVLVLTVSVPPLLAVSELSSVEWNKTYAGLQADSVIQTSDGGYAIAGASESGAGALIKTDSTGNPQWQKGLGNAGNPVSLVQTNDSTYVLFCENYIVKMNAGGNFQSSITFGLSGVREGILTSDGYYVLVGESGGNNGEDFAWLLKIGEQGNLLWNRTFTGGFIVYTVIETNDRGFAVAGSWKNDFWFAKLDSNGNLQWSQTYAYGETSDLHHVSSMARTKDGGYVLAGTGYWQASSGFVPWLIKLDSQGHEQWSLPYGDIPNNGFSSVVQTDDEGYALTESDTAVLVRTDAFGNEQWNLAYADTNVGNYRSSTLVQTKDGGYVLVGTVYTVSNNDVWLTKISPEPNVRPPLVSVLSPEIKTYDTSDIPLTFTINEPTSWVGYSLDGHDNVTITGNITLADLPIGAHNLTVYVKNIAGNIGASGTIHFTLAEPFPIEWIVASVVTVAAVGVSLLVYFKKQSLRSLFRRQTLIAIANNNIVRTLTIISLCMILVLVQIFFPYSYFSSSSGGSKSTFEVGVTYVYEQDDIGQIYNEVARIHDLGIRIIRVNMVSDSTGQNDYLNAMTDVFFAATQHYNMSVALIIQNNEDTNEIQYYLNRWGKYLSYIQILNEPESSSSWDVGALFTDDEIVSKFEQVYSLVEQYQLPVQLYTNFGPGFVLRSNIPIQLSEKLNFVGLDVYMESFLVLSPNLVQLLHKITNKDVVITEFGVSTSDDAAQSDYIIRGLNLFRSMGLKGCWIVYWNSAGDYYGIRGRLAEKTVGAWIAQNVKTS